MLVGLDEILIFTRESRQLCELSHLQDVPYICELSVPLSQFRQFIVDLYISHTSHRLPFVYK
jgi:hypothetical protein